MRLFLPLLAAALVVSACDGTDPVETFAGPTVEFGAASASASEADGTVSIPVRLSNGTSSTSVTVEVLYAAAASTTDFGDDVTGFGTEAGANRVATVTLTGESDEQVVTVDVVDDGEAESAEAAVFVLQRVSGGARIGATREFRLEIGTPPISAARAREVGETVTVEGVVTSATGRFTFLQDDTGAITVFSPSGTDLNAAIANGSLEVGDVVQIAGLRAVFNDLVQIDNVSSFEVVSEDNELPDAQEITLAEMLSLGDAVMSKRVRIGGLTVTDPAGAVVFQAGSQTVTDGTATSTMFIQGESTAIGADVPAGPFTYEGPVTHFRGTNQLGPLSPCEIVELRDTAGLDCSNYTR